MGERKRTRLAGVTASGGGYEGACWESQEAVDECGINLCSTTAMGPRCGRCKFDESPRSYMRDDTECEKCTGREGE